MGVDETLLEDCYERGEGFGFVGWVDFYEMLDVGEFEGFFF